MSNYKSYRWNRNAATHRDALTRFAIIGFLAAGMVALFIGMALLPQERTTETYSVAAIGTLLTLAFVWVLVTGFLTWAYWALNETQFKSIGTGDMSTPHPPTPPLKEKQPVAYYANGEYQGHI